MTSYPNLFAKASLSDPADNNRVNPASQRRHQNVIFNEM